MSSLSVTNATQTWSSGRSSSFFSSSLEPSPAWDSPACSTQSAVILNTSPSCSASLTMLGSVSLLLVALSPGSTMGSTASLHPKLST